jgi:sulfhydrogenase subunit delta
MKPRVAIFDFGCCEGCQLQIVNLEEQILDLLGVVDVVTWREAMTEQSDEFDIAIVEGSITREEEVPRLQWIRDHARILVAIGACAHIGGINCLKNRFDLEEVRRYVYGEHAEVFDTSPTRPVGAVVQVDAVVPGCPIDRQEFVEIVKDLLLGKKPQLPTYAVCVECKRKNNVCLFDKGMVCLGPVTRAGCGAICPSFGNSCEGCRGLVPDPNLNSHREVLAQYGLSVDEILRFVNLYGGCQPEIGCFQEAVEATGGPR